MGANSDYFSRKKEHEEKVESEKNADKLETEAFKNKLGILFTILREGDSFRRFEREVAAAAFNGVNIGNINDGRHFVDCALESIEKIIWENLSTVFTNIDPATKEQAEI